MRCCRRQFTRMAWANRSCSDGLSLRLGLLAAVIALFLCGCAGFACEETPLYAIIQHSLTGQPGSWGSGNLVICAGTRVYFRAVDDEGSVASVSDLDISSCDGSQLVDTAHYYWDFDYDSGVDAEGVGETEGVADLYTTFEPGEYVVHLLVHDDVLTSCHTDDNLPGHVDPSDQITVTVVEPDIDTDSDNDGVIEAEDDDIEELYPGRYVQIDGALARVDLGYVPTLAGWQLRLQATGSGVIGVYSDSAGTTLLSPMPHTYTIPTVTPSVYVKGLQEGSATLEWAYLDGSGNPACTDTVRFTAVTSLPDEGLPKDNLNNAAGAARRNIRWSNPDTSVAYADEFVPPTGNWTIHRIRMWAVPPVPVTPAYALGDHYSAISLWTGSSTGNLSLALSGTLQLGSSSTTNITCTPVMYDRPSPIDDEDYQLPDGTCNKVWQVDFSGLNWEVTGGSTYRCGMTGVPRYDRLWFTHATYTSGVTNQFLSFDPTDGSIIDDDLTGSGWFGKGSNLDIQVFYSPR